MILVLFTWMIVLLAAIPVGTAVVSVMQSILPGGSKSDEITFDFAYFTGLLTLVFFLGLLSVFMPVNSISLIVILAFAGISVFYYRSESTAIFNDVIIKFKKLSIPEKIFLGSVVLMILTAVSTKITWSDSLAYHAQNIQWIRKYSVVPGLGNLHDRFAFNSMFFVLSAPFTFRINDILIFPINAVSFIILVIRMVFSFSRSWSEKNLLEAIFYILPVLFGILMMLPNLNTPSPDIICGVLIVYLFYLIFSTRFGESGTPLHFFLICLICVNLITFKLSSLLIVLSILLVIRRKSFISIALPAIVFLLYLTPFLIRNYYLSGYLIYPFPAVDIFNTDWKIPVEHVLETKGVIEAWARIPVLAYNEVLSMKFSEWSLIWIDQLNFNNKVLIAGNLLFIISMFVMLIRREFRIFIFSAVILINLVFWFIMAPDTRFAYGFIFTGFALNAAYFINISRVNSIFRNTRVIKFILLLLISLVFLRRIKLPVETLSTPRQWVLPARFGPVETRERDGNFAYRMPVGAEECFYSDIPCVSYLRDDVYLRTGDLKDGFRIVAIEK